MPHLESSLEHLIRNGVWNLQKARRRLLPYSKINDVSISLNSRMPNVEIIRDFPHEILFTNYKQELSPARRSVVLRNAIVNSRTGVVWSNGRILKESSVWSVIDLLRWEPKPLFAKRLSGNFVLLPDNGFYHFLIEELPRFLDALHEDATSTILYGSKSSYLIDFLKLADLTNSSAFASYPVCLSSLVLSEKSVGGISTNRDIGVLRTYFSQYLSTDLKTGRSIFISRKESVREHERGLKHYGEVEKLMESLGVLVVYLEDHKLEDQIRLISSARNLVGFHGAGLANLIWMPEGSRVVEIVFERQTSHFEHLSALAGHKYSKIHINQFLSNPSIAVAPKSA